MSTNSRRFLLPFLSCPVFICNISRIFVNIFVCSLAALKSGWRSYLESGLSYAVIISAERFGGMELMTLVSLFGTFHCDPYIIGQRIVIHRKYAFLSMFPATPLYGGISFGWIPYSGWTMSKPSVYKLPEDTFPHHLLQIASHSTQLSNHLRRAISI